MYVCFRILRISLSPSPSLFIWWSVTSFHWCLFCASFCAKFNPAQSMMSLGWSSSFFFLPMCRMKQSSWVDCQACGIWPHLPNNIIVVSLYYTDCMFRYYVRCPCLDHLSGFVSRTYIRCINECYWARLTMLEHAIAKITCPSVRPSVCLSSYLNIIFAVQ